MWTGTRLPLTLVTLAAAAAISTASISVDLDIDLSGGLNATVSIGTNSTLNIAGANTTLPTVTAQALPTSTTTNLTVSNDDNSSSSAAASAASAIVTATQVPPPQDHTVTYIAYNSTEAFCDAWTTQCKVYLQMVGSTSYALNCIAGEGKQVSVYCGGNTEVIVSLFNDFTTNIMRFVSASLVDGPSTESLSGPAASATIEPLPIASLTATLTSQEASNAVAEAEANAPALASAAAKKAAAAAKKLKLQKAREEEEEALWKEIKKLRAKRNSLARMVKKKARRVRQLEAAISTGEVTCSAA